ncbi:MAG TPA: beta-galactosidase [Paludibacter sp.]|nr:beta-galactosidase [Paludibacter sp.]
MKGIKGILGLVVLLFMVAVSKAEPAKCFRHPDRISYDGACLKIGGKDVFVYSAAFHYFRTPKELWRDRFEKIKAAGFNTVETYVPWNLHELNMPKSMDDFSQVNFNDLKEWLDMAQNEFGFYTVLRPGAFICAEFAGGAYPRWLAKYRPDDVKDFWLRSADSRYLAWHDHWYKAACGFIAKEQITAKPKGAKGVILMQIENEYNYHKTTGKEDALRHMYNTAVKSGIEIPIFTCMTSETRGSNDSILSKVFDCDNYYVGKKEALTCASRMADLKAKQPDAPGFVTELQGGWFSTLKGTMSEDHFSNEKHFYALGMMSVLGGSTGIFPYVFVGGTHFSGWGARGMTTTYDYNAAIRENGALSPKYYAAKNLGKFINTYSSQLIHSRGGVCTLKDVPAGVGGGLRVAQDGTRFVFVHNSSDNPASGTMVVKPNEGTKSGEPIYNYDQNEAKVQINVEARGTGLAGIADMPVQYSLEPMETKVLIIPAGATPEQGNWWTFTTPGMEKTQPVSIRIKEVRKYNEDFKAKWQPIAEGVSLPEIGVNDARYVLYRSTVNLTTAEAEKFNHLLFNVFSRDIINLQVNGQLAKREYPSETKAAEAMRPREFSYKFITGNDYLNRFNVKGLLRGGKNNVQVVYENIGHEHGYFPMEELCGIRKAGFGETDSVLLKKLNWEVAADLGGVKNGFTKPTFNARKWQVVQLDTTTAIARKGNNIQPKAKQDALFTWYRAEFKLPVDASSKKTWRLLVNASGNGYIYVNGHNIGRHWEVGPQREFYIPECWLNNDGKPNVVVLGLQQTMNGAEVKAMEIASYANNAVE